MKAKKIAGTPASSAHAEGTRRLDSIAAWLRHHNYKRLSSLESKPEFTKLHANAIRTTHRLDYAYAANEARRHNLSIEVASTKRLAELRAQLRLQSRGTLLKRLTPLLADIRTPDLQSNGGFAFRTALSGNHEQRFPEVREEYFRFLAALDDAIRPVKRDGRRPDDSHGFSDRQQAAIVKACRDTKLITIRRLARSFLPASDRRILRKGAGMRSGFVQAKRELDKMRKRLSAFLKDRGLALAA